MEKKNNFCCIKQHQLRSALNESLPKILQILEVTLEKLVLRMDAEASVRSEEKFRDLQNQTNNNTINVYNSRKKPRLGIVTDICEEEEEIDYMSKRLMLAHTIIDILNTIEAGSKSQVIKTTEVPLLMSPIILSCINVRYFYSLQILKMAILSVKYFYISLNEPSKCEILLYSRYFIRFISNTILKIHRYNRTYGRH